MTLPTSGRPASNTGLPVAPKKWYLRALAPVVDTLYLSLESTATSQLLRLEKSCNPFVSEQGVKTTIETESWTLSPGKLRGQHGYDYIARGVGANEGIQVLWGASKAAKAAPSARRFKVMIGSEVLWRHHVHGGNAWTAATELLDLMTGDLFTALPAWSHILVRRLDVCVDHWGYRWSADDLKRFACRQSLRAMEERGKRVTLKSGEKIEETAITNVSTHHGPNSATYYVGDRGGASRFFRVYNKIAEAMSSGKLPWMEPIWRQNGWDGETTVWRAEIEHGGTWLKDHGMDSVEKLKGCEHALWEEYLEDVRHTAAVKRTRVRKAPTSRVWRCIGAAVRRAKKLNEKATWEWQPRPPRPEGDMKQLAAMAAGCLRKIRGAMFAGKDPAQLMDYITKAIEQSDERAVKRQAHLHRMNQPRPPPPQGAA